MKQDKTTDLSVLNKKPELYVWGEILRIHEIGEYSIIESTKYCPDEKIEVITFHPYFNGRNLNHGYRNLDDAIAYAIAYKYDGCNTSASVYFMAALKHIKAN